MSEILINYEQVYSRTAALQSHINNDLLTRIENEYAQIQAMIDRTDGATNARLKEQMEANRKKYIVMMDGLNRLLSFMSNSSREFEQNEKEMAGVIASGAPDTTQGGEE